MFKDPVVVPVPVDLLLIIIIVFSLGIIWSSLDYYRRSKEHWRWIKLTYASVGVMWVIIETAVLLNVPYTLEYEFRSDIIRPAITYTLAIMLAGSLTSMYRVTGSKFRDNNPITTPLKKFFKSKSKTHGDK